jgi:hypothetical protein
VPGGGVAAGTIAVRRSRPLALQEQGAGSGKAIRVADVDLDGKPDLVLATANAQKAHGIVWMSYRKSPLDETWDVHDISGMEGIKFDLIQLIDLDNTRCAVAGYNSAGGNRPRCRRLRLSVDSERSAARRFWPRAPRCTCRFSVKPAWSTAAN